MADKLRHWEIGKGRAATQLPPYPDHRTMEMVDLEEGTYPRPPWGKPILYELRKNVARRRKPFIDVGNDTTKE